MSKREILDLTPLQIAKHKEKPQVDWFFVCYLVVCVLVTLLACLEIKKHADNPTEYELFMMENYKKGITLQDMLRTAENGS